MTKIILTASVCFLFIFIFNLDAQPIKYPYPVKYFNLNIEGGNYTMAFMDIKPSKPNGESVILFHGKNFNGFYWKNVIAFLSNKGYRVIVPDQIGWGKSSKPKIKYSFEMLARNNRLLLDSLQIEKVNVAGHSMGGMLATRFALMYPEKTAKLILEDPLGLEDYKKFVPHTTVEDQYKKELKATYASYKKYQTSYYPIWKTEYEVYVKAQAEPLTHKDFSSGAWINALTYQMIYEQPVVDEFKNISVPTLLIVGEADHTFIGKDLVEKENQKLYGNFPQLAKETKEKIKNCRVIILPEIGHIPHIQDAALFNKQLLEFLQSEN
jgi:pimeloyl-ACP methyl ester carboxylesterase